MSPNNNRKYTRLEELSFQFTSWVGTTTSVIVHTILFIGIFSLLFFDFTLDNILLILTTAVSLEAIYLAIFIQMSINRNTQSLEAVEEDVEEIAKDVDEIQEDVDEIQEEDDEEDTKKLIGKIENQLNIIMEEISQLKKGKK